MVVIAPTKTALEDDPVEFEDGFVNVSIIENGLVNVSIENGLVNVSVENGLVNVSVEIESGLVVSELVDVLTGQDCDWLRPVIVKCKHELLL